MASTGTIVTVALLVRSKKDFRWGTLGLLLAVTTMAMIGLFNKHESYTGVDPIQGSNENAFSSAGTMLLAGYIAMDKEVARWFKLILVACSDGAGAGDVFQRQSIGLGRGCADRRHAALSRAETSGPSCSSGRWRSWPTLS